TPHSGVDVLEPGREEVADLQLTDQVRDGRELQVTGLTEPPHDDLLDGPGPIHERQELHLAGLELVMEEVARVGDHRVVVAPSELELPHLDVGRELWSELGGIQLGSELVPDTTPVLG